MTVDSTPERQFDSLLRDLARTPDVASVRRTLKPGTTLAARFRIEEQLGRGGMGRVFAAFDERRGKRVALKMLGNITPEAILQIKAEFRCAAELNHPNLVRLHELFFDGLEWFFAMDLVEGVTLPELQASAGPLPRRRLKALFQQLALALCELHQSGMLHSDFKPSNFLIKSDDAAVVLDFGLARPLATPYRRYARSGTPGYMSPEQESGGSLTEASDWYSFGVVLFEALFGKRPDGLTTSHTVRSDPLHDLARSLLEPDPARRASSESILRALDMDPRLAARRLEHGADIVGRRAELAALRDALRETASRRKSCVMLVQGPSGIGKTTLVEQFASEARSQGAFVLSGRCRERESIGHKAVDVLIDDLVGWLDSLPRSEASSLIPPGIGDLTRLFPALRAVAVIARAPRPTTQLADQVLARQRAIEAFTQLLANLAARAPLVIWIDDLQWADAESALLLGPLLARRADNPILLVASLRNISRPCPLLQALFGESELELPAPAVLELGPLSAEESRSLVRRLLPESEHDISTTTALTDDAAGHPLFLAELARAREFQTGEELPLNLTALITRRVSALPHDARCLVETMALAGAPLSRAVARLARDFEPERVERALDTLRAHRLVRSEGMQEDDDLNVLHDRIREIIVHNLNETTRRSNHYALARALESQPSTRPDLIATHFDAAGALPEAGSYWILAADRAAQSLAFDRAAQLYRLGGKHALLDVEQRGAIQLSEANMLSLAGRGAEAADLYLAAAQGRPRNQALDLKRMAAQQLLQVGHLDRAMVLVDEVLRGFGLRPMRRGYLLFAAILFGRARVRMRGYAFTERSEADLTSEDLSRIDAAWTLAASFGTFDPLRGAVLQTSHLLLALKAGEPKRVLRALSLEASYTGLAGKRTRALYVMSIVERVAKNVDDRSAHGLVELLRGMSDYCHGNVASARVSFERALDSFAAHCAGGVFFETLTAKRFLVASLFYLGRFAELSRRVPALLAEAASQGNLYATTTFRTHFGSIAWLAKDEVTEARRQLATARAEWTSTNFPVPQCAMFIAEIYISLYTGEFELAWRRILDYWPTIRATHVLHISLLRFQLWYLRAACALGAAHAQQRAGALDRAAALRNEALHAARKVRSHRSELAEPLGDLLLAIVESGNARDAQARRRLTRCIERMDRDGLQLYAALARLRLAKLDETARAGLERDAHRIFEREGVVSPERIQNLLVPG